MEYEPDEPTPIDQISPEILTSWDAWIRDKSDKTKHFDTSFFAGARYPARMCKGRPVNASTSYLRHMEKAVRNSEPEEFE